MAARYDLSQDLFSMPETVEPNEAARKLFLSPCSFIWAAAEPTDLPPLGPMEIAFAGRSNVGKSSLLNALTKRNHLARTSDTPGRTQQLNFFALGPDPQHALLRLVDMPGYGYAAVGREKVRGWTELMKAYLRGRPSLARVYVLIDGRHGLKQVDEEMFDSLDDSALSYQIVLTKKDKVKNPQAMRTGVQQALQKRPAAHPDIPFVSSHNGEGIEELRNMIWQLGQERNAFARNQH